MINKTKAETAEQAARNAIEKGRHVFVFKFIEAMTNSMATGPMTGLNDQIEAIESLGWRMEHLAVGEGKALSGERLAIVCLFRR
ncbi:hypothetical protein [Streptomyces rimosus]|uniref:hypothetical protein n=1 Tax=Streptomyces rimosus TaxID=1927 RepID=UPI000AA5F11F|nr:hypothetical protein [Streptomyces rimosus]